MESGLYFELLEITEKQDKIIARQNKLIAKLTVDNLEKENTISELTKHNT